MQRWNKLSLKNQFIILFVIIQIIILGLIFYYFIQNHTQFYYEQLKNNLANEIKLILANKKADITINSADEIDKTVKQWGQELGIRITIIKKDGIVIADSTYDPLKMDNHRNRPEIKDVLTGKQEGISSRKSKTLNKEMFYLAHPIEEEGEVIGIIRLAKSLKIINSVVKKDIIKYFMFIVLILIITIIVIWNFSSKLINPLNKITEMAREIAHGNYKKRIELINYENEIGIMARMFNYMAEQLENKILEISDEKNKMEAVLRGMADGIIATDCERKTVLVNPAARKMFAYGKDDILGKDIIQIVRNHRIDECLAKAIDSNSYLEEEVIVNSPEGDHRNIRCHFAPITDETANVSGGVIVFTDITELRRLEQVRKDFVANVSHELRTPLTSIIGYVDTLLESNIEDPVTTNKFLQIIKKEADRLSILIRDLLNLSRVEGQSPDLRPNRLEEVIEKPLNILEDLAEEKEIRIEKEFEDNLPLVLMIPGQIEQVFINLIDNAIKYNEPGGKVIIRVYSNSDKVFVEVEDNGIGIPEADQDRIFERFYRVDKARSRELGGTGIGLSIVKNIIKAHEGNIELESEIGKGTVFKFFLHKAQ